MKKSNTIVFIHGLFMNPKCWNEWIIFFTQKGYQCHAPAYPYHDGEPENLQNNINPNLGKINFDDVLKVYQTFITNLPEKPILIGHSMGGLLVQKLINTDVGIAGVCIDSAPPKGMFSLQWSFLQSNFPVINPFKSNSVFQPTVQWFHRAFCNTLTIQETQKVKNDFVVPESRNIPRSSTSKSGSINFSKPHAPLLFIAGEKDNIIPSALNKKNFKAYKHAESKTDFKEFEGRTHYICGQPNWQEVANYILNWVDNL